MFDYLQYEFRDCDKEFSLLSLEMLCADGAIPWDALTYLVGEVNQLLYSHTDIRGLSQ